MSRIFLVHWHEAEVADLAAPLRDAGHEVTVHWEPEVPPPLREALPDALIVSLARLPSHGRSIAAWLWESKRRRAVPIVFAGGAPEKVAVARQQFPEATYCGLDQLVEIAAELAAAEPESEV